MQKTILVVEDEPALREMIVFSLTQAGFAVLEAGDVSQARKRLAESAADLVLLDWMLPGMSGVELARLLRKGDNTRRLPIIMLTAKGEEEDKLRGLESGADDYMTKPFSTKELIARIHAVLRRTGSEWQAEEKICMGGIQLDQGSHMVTASGKVCDMGPTEYRLLLFFLTHPERVYSRSQLLDHVWGNQVYVEERTVDVHIRRLRKALSEGDCDNLIQTVRGSGYRFSLRA